MVTAGVVPVPVHVSVTVMWLMSTMLKPVTVTLAIVLAALNPVNEPSTTRGASLKPDHWFVVRLLGPV